MRWLWLISLALAIGGGTTGYRQHYLTGGQIVHISAKPVAVKSVILNFEKSE